MMMMMLMMHDDNYYNIEDYYYSDNDDYYNIVLINFKCTFLKINSVIVILIISFYLSTPNFINDTYDD